jgi:hypothetical protein
MSGSLDLDPKDPTDDDVFGWDFSAKLINGDVLNPANTPTIWSEPVGITVVGSPTTDSNAGSVYAKLSGGIAGTIYKVACTVVTANSETYTRRLEFLVTPR